MEKKNNNVVLKIISILFIIFMGLFIANTSGYYESQIHDRMIVTEQGIKEFEDTIKRGDEIDIESFINNTREDYSSKMSNLGDRLTGSLEGFVDEGAKILTGILKSLF